MNGTPTAPPTASRADSGEWRLAKQAQHRLSQAIDTLVRTMPFYAEVMAAWTAKPDPSSRSCGVYWEHGSLQLRYSPAWLESLTVPGLCAVLVHECLHVLFGHPFIESDIETDSRALLIATETTVNEFVKGFPLPGDPLLLEHYPELAPLQSTRERYELLRRPREEQPSDGEHQDADASAGRGPGEPLDDHAGWDSIRQAGLVANLAITVAKDRALLKYGDMVDAATRDAIANGGPGAGTKPGSLSQRVQANKPAWLDWYTILGHLPPPRQRPEPTYSRPPRRRPELAGIVPGRRLVSLPPILLVAVDVSGSMSDQTLGWIKLEVRVLASRYRVALAEIDAKVQRRVLLFDDQSRHPGLVDDVAQGRGGTCLDAAFTPELLAWAGDHEEVDAIVYFTDGFAPPPTRIPAVPTIWVLADEHDRVRAPAPWGTVVGTNGSILRRG